MFFIISSFIYYNTLALLNIYLPFVMKNKIRLVLVLLSIALLSSAQEQDSTLTNKELRKKRPHYIEFGTGVGVSKYKDLASSPLIYNALALNSCIGYLKQDYKRESKIQLRTTTGSYIPNKEGVTTKSSAFIFDFSITKLYALNKFSNQKWNFKVGGLVDFSLITRVNSSLQNNALGVDMFANLMGSGKVTRDVSRKNAKQKKFLWIKYNLQPRKRDLSFNLNIGLINSYYRNPYAYLGQSSVVNKTVFFDGYKYHIFSGLRFRTELIYTIYLKNKNALQISYIWDGYRTKSDIDSFGMINNIFKFSFLFNTK